MLLRHGVFCRPGSASDFSLSPTFCSPAGFRPNPDSVRQCSASISSLATSSGLGSRHPNIIDIVRPIVLPASVAILAVSFVNRSDGTAGGVLGINTSLLIRWLAPLTSEVDNLGRCCSCWPAAPGADPPPSGVRPLRRTVCERELTGEPGFRRMKSNGPTPQPQHRVQAPGGAGLPGCRDAPQPCPSTRPVA